MELFDKNDTTASTIDAAPTGSQLRLNKKLRLNKEALRTLSGTEIGMVAGGMAPGTKSLYVTCTLTFF
jgi:hypothetical protein